MIVPFGHKELKLTGLGRGDGTWVIPVELIGKDSICYCFGVGEDISFDIALAKLGARVFSFDPTPRAIEYMRTTGYDRERISFMPVGIWREDTTLKFYKPMGVSVNYSVANVHGSQEYFDANCHRLVTIMQKLGHDHVDLVKIDIEGSWYEVVEDILKSKAQIKVLCIEFDSPTNILKVTQMIRLLKQSGYTPVHKDRRENFLFVNDRLIGKHPAAR